MLPSCVCYRMRHDCVADRQMHTHAHKFCRLNTPSFQEVFRPITDSRLTAGTLVFAGCAEHSAGRHKGPAAADGLPGAHLHPAAAGRRGGRSSGGSPGAGRRRAQACRRGGAGNARPLSAAAAAAGGRNGANGCHLICRQPAEVPHSDDNRTSVQNRTELRTELTTELRTEQNRTEQNRTEQNRHRTGLEVSGPPRR